MEPTLASAEEMDEIVDLRRRPPGEKPVMRVTAEDLRGTGILKILPEFMVQIARSGGAASAGRDAASRPSGVLIDPAILGDGGDDDENREYDEHGGGDDDDDGQFELDEEQAQGRAHVEMEIVAGILEERGGEGGEDGDGDENQEGFELAIPPAGTAPSTKTAITGTATTTRAPMIRPLSSSESEASSSDDDDESSPPILQRNFGVEDGPTTAATATDPAGRPTRSRSHCVSVSMSTPPTSLPASEQLSNTVNAATSWPARPRQQPAVEDSDTSSSGTSSSEEEDGESEEDEEEDEDGEDEDEDADAIQGLDGPPLPVPIPVLGARPAPPPAGGIAAHPDGSRKRSCTESSLVRDAAVQGRSDRKRVRPLIEEIE